MYIEIQSSQQSLRVYSIVLLIQFWDNEENQINKKSVDMSLTIMDYADEDDDTFPFLPFLLFLSNILVNSSFVMTPSPSGSSSAIISWN